MEIKVLYNGDCLKIGDQVYRHHKKGGGLVSVNAKVDEGAYIALGAKVKDFATVEGGAAIYNHAEVRDRAVIRSGVVIAGQTVVGGDAEIFEGYFDVSYKIATGKINSGKSGRWERARENVILPIEEAEIRELNKLEKIVDSLETILNSE